MNFLRVKLFKIIKYIFLSSIFIILIGLISIDRNYINKPSITFDIKNINNPQLKKIVRSLDNYISYFYLNLSKRKKNEFNEIDLAKYNELPNEILIKGKKKKFNNFK